MFYENIWWKLNLHSSAFYHYICTECDAFIPVRNELLPHNVPSSSLPIIVYLSKPLKFRCVPSPKSSFVHCRMPVLPITRQGSVTRVPTTVVWSCGSIANFCSSISPIDSVQTLNIRSRRSRNLCCVVISIVANLYLERKKVLVSKIMKVYRIYRVVLI